MAKVDIGIEPWRILKGVFVLNKRNNIQDKICTLFYGTHTSYTLF